MIMSHINWVSVFIVVLFLLPLVNGMLRPLTDSRIFNSFSAILGAVQFLVSAGLSILITQAVFKSPGDTGPGSLLRSVTFLREAAEGRDILAYALVLLLLMIVLSGILHLALLPVVKLVSLPLSARIARRLAGARCVVRRICSAAWELPKAAGLVLLLSLVLNFYVALSNNSALCGYIGASQAYRFVEEKAVRPIIASKAAQAIPTLVDDTVDRVVDCLSPEGRKLLIRVYINGMTVEEAVKSSPDIDNVAIDLVDTETDDYKKAELIYEWVCSQISYDKDKADSIAVDAFAVTSGSVTAFSEKTGVCFDKACLIVSMCRAVDVPVRLVTGQGFNGASWEDHSWNQIHDAVSDRWINVDATFGSGGSDYFDRDGFGADHRYDEIQGEW